MKCRFSGCRIIEHSLYCDEIHHLPPDFMIIHIGISWIQEGSPLISINNLKNGNKI